MTSFTLADLGAALDSAQANGSLPPPAGHDGAVRLAKRYLNWLGYGVLEADNANKTPSYKKALKQFQQDTKLRTTGKLNLKTQQALQQLVAFEVDQRPLLHKLAPDNPALQRAIRLRLNAYGFSQQSLPTALEQFSTLLWMLQLTDTQQPDTPTILRFLFDLDAITQHIKGDDTSFAVRIPPGLSSQEKKQQIKQAIGFIRAIAAIELYLSGYDSTIAEQDWQQTPNIGPALRAFWQDQPKALRPTTVQQTLVTGEFFTRINQLQANNTEQSSEKKQKILKQLHQDKALNQAVQQQSKNILSRLWDGIKRAARHLFSLFDSLAKQLRKLARNIARWLVAEARDTWRSIKQFFTAFAISYRFLTEQLAAKHSQDDILINLSATFDVCQIINPDGNRETQHNVSTRYQLAARMFKLCMQSIGLLLDTIKAVRGLFALPWLTLITALVKMDDHYEEIKTLQTNLNALMTQWKALAPSPGT